MVIASKRMWMSWLFQQLIYKANEHQLQAACAWSDTTQEVNRMCWEASVCQGHHPVHSSQHLGREIYCQHSMRKEDMSAIKQMPLKGDYVQHVSTCCGERRLTWSNTLLRLLCNHYFTWLSMNSVPDSLTFTWTEWEATESWNLEIYLWFLILQTITLTTMGLAAWPSG